MDMAHLLLTVAKAAFISEIISPNADWIDLAFERPPGYN